MADQPLSDGLIIKGLTKSFGTVRAVHDVSLQAARGRMTALLGPNGAGKSTLLHCITGLLHPDAGEVLLDGRQLTREAPRQDVGFAPDDLPLPDLLTGWEYLDFVAELQQVHRDDARVERLTLALGLSGALDRLLGTYSHGMRRKIQLLAAVNHQPGLLILDEPFRGLDPESTALLKSVLRQYVADGRAVLVSTHDLLVAEQMCDDIAILGSGCLLAAGNIQRLVQDSPGSSSLEEAFLRITGLDASTRTSARDFLRALDA